MSTALYDDFIRDSLPEHKELNLQVWRPTPFMIDVFTKDREHAIRNWCNHYLGKESNPIHGYAGMWIQAGVTIHGWCWFGFATEKAMNNFLKQFPSPPKP